MKINQALNFVIPVETEANGIVFVHAMPITAETFDVHWDVLGQTHSKIISGGHGLSSGSRIASKALRDISKQKGVWDGAGGTELGIVREVRRLASVIVPEGIARLKQDDPIDGQPAPPPQWRATGWKPVGLEEAVKLGVLDARDADEVENNLVFFTVNSVMRRRKELELLLGVASEMSGLWQAHTTSLTATAYSDSLPTLSEGGSSGVKAPASSRPS